MPSLETCMPSFMKQNQTEIPHIDPLRYSELKDFCTIIGIEVRDVAPHMGYTKESLYNARYLRRTGAGSYIEFSRLDGIIGYVGEEDYRIALAELRLTKEERENPRNTQRITWDEGKKVLKLCGVTIADFAYAILLTPSTVSHLMGWYRRRLIPLRDIRALKNLVGAKNFETALRMVRK